MKKEIRYIELKSGHAHHGPAWIAEVQLSKSGRTVYFNGKALKPLKRKGHRGNHYDIETEEIYWISGVKKDGTDRHKYGGGKVMIDREIVPDYLALVGLESLDPSKTEVVSIPKTDVGKFAALENEK